MKKFLGMTFLLAAQLTLVACGGGSDGPSSTTPGGGGSGGTGSTGGSGGTGGTGGSGGSGGSGGTGGTGSTGGTTATSYWTMDARNYVNSGKSSQQTSTINNRPYTVVVASTENDTGNGAYSGSSLSIQMVGTGAGTYTVVSDTNVLLNADPATMPIYIQAGVGTGVATGSTFYVATSGQVSVTVDNAGKYHFTAAQAIPTAKSTEVGGGVDGAPASMALVMQDVF